MAGNSGGPWGGGNSNGGNGGGGNRGNGSGGGNGNGPRRPGGDGQNIPELDDLMRKGQEQLRVLMGGRGGGTGGTGQGGDDPISPRTMWIGGIILVLGTWLYASFYSVQPGEQGVELFLGSEYRITGDGPHLAPWPLITAEVLGTDQERTEAIGNNRSGACDTGLMLTTDENIVDVDFQVVWNINDPAKFLFNLAEPRETLSLIHISEPTRPY